MHALHAVAGWIVLVCAGLLAVGLIAWSGTLVKPFRKVSSTSVLILACVAAAAFLELKPLIPHNIWHEQHAVDLIADIEIGRDTEGFDYLHGSAYSTIMGALRAATFGRVSVFSLNYGISTASVILLFLLVFLVSRREFPAVTAAALLLLLPAHLRLAVTESMFVPLECLSLLAALLFALYLRLRDNRPLILAALTCLLIVHLRAEMMALLPILVAAYAYALRAELPSRRRLRKAITVLTGAALLAAPRFAEILLNADPRNKELLPSSGLRHFWELGAGGLNVFFDPALTFPLLPVLMAAGAVFLYRKHRRLLAALAFHGALLTYFYSIHLTCLSLRIRTALASQYVLVILAACGLFWIADAIRGKRKDKKRTVAAAALIAVVAWTGNIYGWPLLLRRYTKQMEYDFLIALAKKLPDRSVVVYLSNDDDEGLLQNRSYQAVALALRAREAGRRVTATGIKAFLEAARGLRLDGVYFYKGTPCHTPPRTIADPIPAPAGPSYVHPLCARMDRGFLLETVDDRLATPVTHTQDRMAGGPREMALYRLRPREASDGTQAWAYFRDKDDPIPAARGFWTRAAAAALRHDIKSLALWALSKADPAGPEQRERIARLYLALNEPARAVDMIQPAACRECSAPEPFVILARAARLAGKRDRALDALRRAEGLGPSAEQSRRIARLYFELESHDRALPALKRIARESRGDAILHTQLAAAAHRAGDSRAASEALEKARELARDPAELRGLAALYMTMGKLRSASEILGGLDESESGGASLWIGLAYEARDARDAELALASLRRAGRLDPGPVERARMAELLLELKQSEEALAVLDGGSGKGAADSRALLDLAAAARGSGKRARALKALDRAGGSLPAGELRRAADLYISLNEHGRAVPLLRKLAERGKDASLWLETAAAAKEAGLRDEALLAVERARGSSPDPKQRALIGRLYLGLGRHAEALEALEPLSGTADAGTLVDLALAAEGAGKRERALKALAGAGSRGPDADELRRIAVAYQRVEKRSEALRILDRLIRKTSTPGLLNDRGVLKGLMGDTEGAIADLEAAVAQDPGLISASLTLGGLHASRGDRDKALETYRRALEKAPPGGLRSMLEREAAKLSGETR